MLEALLFLPLGAGLIMLLVGNAAFCRGLLPLTALGHVTLSLLTVARVARGEQPCALGGLLAPLERMDSESLDLDRLTRRLDEGEVTELILALGATLEAENTASFIRQMVRKRFPRIRVSRLAQGIPLGAEVKYMDKETLRQSLQYRQDL